MSILIKGLKMPEEGSVFVVFVDRSKRYVLYNDMQYPLIELPDHGDLIDRDEIFMQLRMDFAEIERMASDARAMAKDYLDGEKFGMGKAMIRVYEHEAIITAERSEDDGNK